MIHKQRATPCFRICCFCDLDRAVIYEGGVDKALDKRGLTLRQKVDIILTIVNILMEDIMKTIGKYLVNEGLITQKLIEKASEIRNQNAGMLFGEAILEAIRRAMHHGLEEGEISLKEISTDLRITPDETIPSSAL